MENQKPGAQGPSAGAQGVPGKRRNRRGGRRHRHPEKRPAAALAPQAVKAPAPVLRPVASLPPDKGGLSGVGVSAPSAIVAPVIQAPAPAADVPRKSRNFRAATGPVPPPNGPGLGTYAFLDAQNISVSASRQHWKIDWYLVRKWLSDAYDVRRAIMFLGYMEAQEPMYDYFTECGYDVVFKPVRVLPNGETKGNVDAEIVLHAMAAYPHYDRAVLISGDGDFSCLVTYLRERGKLHSVVVPNLKGASGFLEEAAGGQLDDMTAHRAVMTYVPGRPGPKPQVAADGAPKAVRTKRDARGKVIKPKPAAPQAKAPAPQKPAPQSAAKPQQPRPQAPQQQKPAPKPNAQAKPQPRPQGHQPHQAKPQNQQRPPVPAQQRPQQPQKPKPNFPPRGNQPKPQQGQRPQQQQQRPPQKGRPGDDVDYSDFASLNSF